MIIYIIFLGQSHSSVERAGLLGGVKLRSLQPDDNNKLSGETLEKAIQEDLEAGLIPFYVSKIQQHLYVLSSQITVSTYFLFVSN